MSLSLKNENNDFKPIAQMIGQKKNIIYLNDNEEVDMSGEVMGGQKLRKLKIIDGKSEFFPIISKEYKQNERIFICGKSGCGKTYYFIRPYIIEFLRVFKGSKVYFFSSKSEDEAVDDLPIKRVHIDDDFVENPPDIRQFTNKDKINLVVFDDIQDYQNQKQNKAVARLRDEMLRNGRSLGLYLVYVWHKPADRKNTEQQIFESTATVIFPKTSGHDDYNYMMERYLGIKNVKTRNLLSKAKSNFVYVIKKSPSVAISNNYILVL